MVKAFLNVKYSVSNDEALRLLLATEYSGKTGSRPYYRDLYEVVTKFETYVKTIVPVIIPLIESDINGLKGIEAPFPLQTSDFSLLYPRIKPLIYDHPTYWNLVRSGTEMDTVIENFMDYLMTLTNRIAQVCDGRTTRTAGDKIAITLMMKVMDDMDSLLMVFDEYAQDTTYDLVMQLKPEELDDLLASLEVMAYIYGLEPEFGDILTGSN